jgi:hypothetical protein
MLPGNLFSRAATEPWKVLQGPANVSWPNFIEKGNEKSLEAFKMFSYFLRSLLSPFLALLQIFKFLLLFYLF